MVQVPGTARADLEIFKESKRLALSVHAMLLKLPKFELYEEGSQIRRSSKSVTSNSVEGYGRKRYKAEFVRHLIVALQRVMKPATPCFYRGVRFYNEHKQLRTEYEVLSKKIYTYIKWVEANFHPAQ